MQICLFAFRHNKIAFPLNSGLLTWLLFYVLNEIQKFTQHIYFRAKFKRKLFLKTTKDEQKRKNEGSKLEN